MSGLELKIPPVLITLVFALLMWVVSLSYPGVPVPAWIKYLLCAITFAAGAFFSIAGVVSFRQARTSVNPLSPGACSSLVTSGVYRRTRNPMYVGFLFFLFAFAAFLFNLYSLALTAGFVLYMNRFQIQPEEKTLESTFGTEYLAYKKRTPRWL